MIAESLTSDLTRKAAGMERYNVHDEYMTPSEAGNVVLHADAQRALDAEREKVKELEAELEEYRSIAEQQGASKAVSQLATLQAQLESANVLIYKKNCALGRADTTITELQAQLRQVEGENQRLKEACKLVNDYNCMHNHGKKATKACDDILEQLDRLAREGVRG